ncbi:MAG: sulfatase-like hydrolase/transferase [Burkholderiales bacterium]
MRPTNLLILMSDEHNPRVFGCAGHREIATPNLDALVARGTRFTSAYTPSPICVPARASLATGRYNHEIGYWDNVDGYDGRAKSWHHAARDAGHEAVAIGKLHFRGWAEDDYGFTDIQNAMYLHEGRGELRMLLREPPEPVGDGSNMLASAGPGESTYTRYDRDVTERACAWLNAKAGAGHPKPWVLMVSMVAPHFPLTAPEQFYAMYADRPLALPKDYGYGVVGTAATHPYDQQYARFSGYNRHFRSEADVRRALAGYYGLLSFMDANVGRVLAALDAAGLAADTRVLYTSDHGDNLGVRGLWGKSTMYEESAGIPLIVAGPDVPVGRVVETPASLVDVYPTVLDALGVNATRATHSRRARSIFVLASAAADPDRPILSEYHAAGSSSAAFMLRLGRYKYIHHIEFAAQLYDLAADQQEQVDLALDPAQAGALAHCRETLFAVLDPVAVNARAKARQRELIAHYGGRDAILKSVVLGGYTPVPNSN